MQQTATQTIDQMNASRVAMERLNMDDALKGKPCQLAQDGKPWIHTGYWMRDILGFWYEAKCRGFRRWFKGKPRGQ